MASINVQAHILASFAARSPPGRSPPPQSTTDSAPRRTESQDLMPETPPIADAEPSQVKGQGKGKGGKGGRAKGRGRGGRGTHVQTFTKGLVIQPEKGFCYFGWRPI